MADYIKRFPEKSDEYQWQIHDERTNDIRTDDTIYVEVSAIDRQK
jgi:hypothetical protein